MNQQLAIVALVSSMALSGLAATNAAASGQLKLACNNLGPRAYCYLGSYNHTDFYDIDAYSNSGTWSIRDFLWDPNFTNTIDTNWGVACPSGCVIAGVGLTGYNQILYSWPGIQNPDPTFSHSFTFYVDYSGSLG